MITTRYFLPAMVAAAGFAVLGARLTSSPPPPERTYVGAETCMRSCHAGAFHDSSDYTGAAAFRQTMHQRIHLRPSPETVVIEKYFAGDSVLKAYMAFAPIPGQDTLLIELSKSADGRDYFVQMRISNQPADTTPRMKVAYTYGGNGWIQRFLVEVDGSFYIITCQYVLPGYRNRSAEGGALS